MPEPLLRLAGVHTNIGAYHILQGVELEIPEAQISVVLGRNGAGEDHDLAHDHRRACPDKGDDNAWRKRDRGNRQLEGRRGWALAMSQSK